MEKSNAELEHLTKVVILAVGCSSQILVTSIRSAREKNGTNLSYAVAGRTSGAGEESKLLQVASTLCSLSFVLITLPKGGSRSLNCHSNRFIPSPPSMEEYQHQLIARMNTNTSSDIFEMDMRDLGRRLGQMSSVWEVSQATSRTISDGTFPCSLSSFLFWFQISTKTLPR